MVLPMVLPRLWVGDSLTLGRDANLHCDSSGMFVQTLVLKLSSWLDWLDSGQDGTRRAENQTNREPKHVGPNWLIQALAQPMTHNKFFRQAKRNPTRSGQPHTHTHTHTHAYIHTCSRSSLSSDCRNRQLSEHSSDQARKHSPKTKNTKPPNHTLPIKASKPLMPNLAYP